MSVALLKDKRLEEAETAVRTAMRLDPHYPATYLVRLAQIQFQLENYGVAADSLQKAVEQDPNDRWAYAYLAAAYGKLNQTEKARNALVRADTLRASAGFGPITLVATASFEFRWRWLGNRTALKEGLRIAGAPRGGEWLKLIIEDGSTQIVEDGRNQRVKGVTTIDAIQAQALHERGAVFVDTQRAWLVERIPGAHFLEWWGVEGWEFNEIALAKLVDPNQELVIYNSRSGGGLVGRISAACALAVSRGIKNVYCFPGGLEAWNSAGYPVDTSKKQ